jgi:hypothetical protein
MEAEWDHYDEHQEIDVDYLETSPAHSSENGLSEDEHHHRSGNE